MSRWVEKTLLPKTKISSTTKAAYTLENGAANSQLLAKINTIPKASKVLPVLHYETNTGTNRNTLDRQIGHNFGSGSATAHL